MADRRIAGAMSGTSADGVDVALVAISGQGLEMTARLVHHHHRPYPPQLRQSIFALRTPGATTGLRHLAEIGREISLIYAAAVNEALLATGWTADDLACVAAHGQTLFHDPPLTIQWFDPSLVAAEVGCPVVSDFRRADCAAGGQGAPLVPFADYILFRHPTISRAVINIGGIANITCLFPGADLGQVIAFDTGPGNCISDHLMRKHDAQGPGVDVGGRLALQGSVSRELFDRVTGHDYFIPLGPKSTDGPAMIRIFEEAMRGLNVSLQDQLATACAFTAYEISRALHLFGGQFDGETIISGGGLQNQAILNQLDDFGLKRRQTTGDFGIPSEAKEALAFALLGAATLDGVPSNVPSVTGATRAVVLGSITSRP